MRWLIGGAYRALIALEFVLSGAYAYSGMLWPAEACLALGMAGLAFEVLWIRPRRPYRPSRRHMRPGHICCYLGPVHVPKFVYEAWDSVAEAVRRPARWHLVEDEPSGTESIHVDSTPCPNCPCCPAALCKKAAADPRWGLRDCSIHADAADWAIVKTCPCAPINHDTVPEENR